jgi:hypothetical protein
LLDRGAAVAAGAHERVAVQVSPWGNRRCLMVG